MLDGIHPTRRSPNTAIFLAPEQNSFWQQGKKKRNEVGVFVSFQSRQTLIVVLQETLSRADLQLSFISFNEKLSIFFRSIFRAAIVVVQEIIVEVVVMTHIRHIDALA